MNVIQTHLTSVTSQTGEAKNVMRTNISQIFRKITLIHYYSEDFTSFKEGLAKIEISAYP